MTKSKLLKAFSKGNLDLKNHLVMAPMTRSRAIDNIPNDLMATYYEQRSGAGLIVTEGTAPSANGLGYSRIPGIFNQAQISGWKKITSAVHKNNGKIFIQLMHTGRIAHEVNLPERSKVIGVSGRQAAGQMYTDVLGMQDHSIPMALTTAEVEQLMEDYVQASKNAIDAGFDGIELHGANGYLLEQFLNPNINDRMDEFGGSIEGRAKFIIEIARKITNAIGKEKLGIRFSPFSTFNDMQPYRKEEVHDTYTYLASELNAIGIAYLHICVNAEIPRETTASIRAHFAGVIILCNGLTPQTAEEALHNGFADLVAFGRSFIANPDLDKRIEKGEALKEADYNTFYTPGKEGYIDYPVLG